VPTSAGGAAVAGVPTGDPVPGTFSTFTTAPLAAPLDLAGVPALTATLDAPTFAAAQAADPATKLVLFAKLEDVAPDGTSTIPGDIVSAARIGDVTKPVRIELPGLVHRFPAGHRLRLVVASSNLLRRGNLLAGPVTIRTGPDATLTLPRIGAPTGAPGSGPSGTTPFAPGPDAVPVQAAGLGGPPPGTRPAAVLPSAKRCVSRRRFTIRLARTPRGDRVRSVRITVNGKARKVTARTVRGRRTATIDLRGLPRGTARIQVTVRTAEGRVLRSARTYRTCAPKR
jgi:hypothetical protein